MAGVIETVDVDPDADPDAESLADLDDESVVLVAGNYQTQTVHLTADCRSLKKATRARTVRVRQLNESWRLCGQADCWPTRDPATTEQTGATCPYCGAEGVGLVGHLPCDGSGGDA